MSARNSASLDKKKQLLKSLKPISKEVKWMKEIISNIKQTELSETNFDMAGLSRKIIYEIMREKPELFEKEDGCTKELKKFVIDCLNNIKIKDNTKLENPFSK